MTSTLLHDESLLDRVRELRAAGRSPKQIARALGVRPATVAPLVRTVAREAAAADPEAVVACWVSPGWSARLTVDGPDDWHDPTAPQTGAEGLVGLLIARRTRPQRVSVCGYLVDVYCLGVKNALGPDSMNQRDLPGFRDRFFAAFEATGEPVPAPLQLARHLVFGAVDYARRLGFEPHPDFKAAAGHLGEPWQDTSAITFGRDGVPFYISGPHDNPNAVLRTLTRSVGEGGFDYVATVERLASR